MRSILALVVALALVGCSSEALVGPDGPLARGGPLAPASAEGKIAFASSPSGNLDIWLMDPDGSNATNVTSHAATDYLPSLSPDGTKIAFASDRDGNLEVYLMDADGANPVRLTTDAGIDGFPDWSPIGLTLAFNSRRDGNTELYLMDIGRCIAGAAVGSVSSGMAPSGTSRPPCLRLT